MHISCGEMQPKYKDIAGQIRNYIRSMCITPGAKLPGGRKFAKMFGVSKNTVYEALSILESEGVVNITSQSGSYVAKDAWFDIASASPNWMRYISSSWQTSIGHDFKELCRYIGDKSVIYLSSSALDGEFGFNNVVADALDKVSERVRTDNILKSYNYKGLRVLREAVSNHLRQKNMFFNPDEIIITPSTAIALEVLFRGLLNSSNIVYVSENIAAYSLIFLNSLGVEIVPIPMDDEGMSIAALQKLDKSPKRPIVITATSSPNFKGETMTLERRKELLDYCRSMRYPIIELDWMSDLNPLAPPPLKALDTSNNVIYIGSIPVYMSLGINVGWIIAPPHLNDRLIDILVQGYHYPFGINYFIMEQMLSDGSYSQFLSKFIPKMYKRMELVDQILKQTFTGNAIWNSNARYGVFELKFPNQAIVKKLINKNTGILFVSNLKLKNIDNSHIYIFTCGISEEKMHKGLNILQNMLSNCSNTI